MLLSVAGRLIEATLPFELQKEEKDMKTDIAERLEKIGNEMLALAAELKADVRHEPSIGLEAQLKQIEKQFGAQTRTVIETLALFGVEAEIRYVEKGPVVDRVVFGIPSGTRYSAVTACKDNIMGALRAHSIRIEAPMPGSDAVSVEFPHEEADREEIAWKPLATKEKLANTDDEDCEEAIELIRKTKRASTSHFQRLLGWGYNHAAHILDLLEERGIVAPPVGAGPREVFYDKIPSAKKAKKAKAKKCKKAIRKSHFSANIIDM